jgi:hypothetical protein
MMQDSGDTGKSDWLLWVLNVSYLEHEQGFSSCFPSSLSLCVEVAKTDRPTNKFCVVFVCLVSWQLTL